MNKQQIEQQHFKQEQTKLHIKNKLENVRNITDIEYISNAENKTFYSIEFGDNAVSFEDLLRIQLVGFRIYNIMIGSTGKLYVNIQL